MTGEWGNALASLPGHRHQPTTKHFCLADETWWVKGDLCPICDLPGVLGSTPPDGWPAVTASEAAAPGPGSST